MVEVLVVRIVLRKVGRKERLKEGRSCLRRVNSLDRVEESRRKIVCDFGVFGDFLSGCGFVFVSVWIRRLVIPDRSCSRHGDCNTR